MSPIYSVTSFLTLLFPYLEGWMAIVKDFYESYCIYTFLSFLIAVLGEGSRDKAVDVLAKHASHLDRPTRCLACLYEPPPDASDHAKANAVMTQCQIYCLQFTLVRPLTTIFSTTFDSGMLVHQTKNYLKSPGFAVAMVVNVSIFFAFSGLLKLYHAVREDLMWCRPFPKFLTIKAVVFLTFWQGLAILLSLVLAAAPEEKEEAYLQARKYQNLLICVEMLLVAISQWCVFPAVEWEPGYEPRQMHTPGLGIRDFVSDVGQIVSNRSRGRRTGKRRKKRGGSSGGKAGLYHMPLTASVVASQYDDGFDGQRGTSDSSYVDDGFGNGNNNSFDSGESHDEDQFETNDEYEYNAADIPYGSSGNDEDGGIVIDKGDRIDRSRTTSESSGGGDNADDENSDNDMELL
eukprot:jgi/Psemu1/237895/estExt_Genewise1.C_810016